MQIGRIDNHRTVRTSHLAATVAHAATTIAFAAIAHFMVLVSKIFSLSVVSAIRDFSNNSEAIDKLWLIIGLQSLESGGFFFHLSKIYKVLGHKFETIGYGCASVSVILTTIFATYLISYKPGILLPNALVVRIRNKPILAKGPMFLVLTTAAVFVDKAGNDIHKDYFSIISNFSYSLSAIALTKRLCLGIDSGIFSFFLGCFSVQLLRISWLFMILGVFLFPLLIHLHG